MCHIEQENGNSSWSLAVTLHMFHGELLLKHEAIRSTQRPVNILKMKLWIRIPLCSGAQKVGSISMIEAFTSMKWLLRA